eukprot:6196786-Pleurochrysis_carterae.AAC.2
MQPPTERRSFDQTRLFFGTQAAFAAYDRALDEQSLKSMAPVKLSELLSGHMALLEKLQRAQWDRLR